MHGGNFIRVPDSDVIVPKHTSGIGKNTDTEDESMVDNEHAIH